jgi:CheY-like chemotaxis protein
MEEFGIRLTRGFTTRAEAFGPRLFAFLYEDGYSLIRRVRQLPPESRRRVPAAALTAYAGEPDRERVLAAGFQCHVAKPVEPADLAATVARLAAELVRPQLA